jgi:hypothetical protein
MILTLGITKNYFISICTHINVTMIEDTLTTNKLKSTNSR